MTLSLEREVFNETKNIVQGRLNRSRLTQEFSAWSMSYLAVRILNLRFFRRRSSDAQSHELLIFVANTEDFQKLPVRHNTLEYRKTQIKIARVYRALALRHRSDFWWNLKDLLVSYYDFSKEARIETVFRAAWEVRAQIKGPYPIVWDAQPWGDGFVVFYPTDDDVILNEYRGISKQIAGTYYSILKKYDDLNCFTQETISLRFDSKINFESKARGSMYYYY